MNSTSSMMRSITSRTATSSQYQVRGIQTYASNVTGGVTSGTTYSHIGAQRRLGAPSPGGGGMTPPSDPTGGCQCEWVWDGTQWVCIHCGSTMTLQDGLNGNFHDPCPCPISFDWTVILFLLALACAYVTFIRRRKKAERNALLFFFLSPISYLLSPIPYQILGPIESTQCLYSAMYLAGTGSAGGLTIFSGSIG